jgi:L-ascorbate metabolism protein UlaG (beta-lactamase superfamily)
VAIEIQWYGRTCFRIRGREGVVVTDPFPPDSGYKLGKLSANSVTVSNRALAAYSYAAGVGDEPKVFDAPGEYEVGGMLIEGVAMPGMDGARNIGFIIEVEGIKVGHLGLPSPTGFKTPEQFGEVDILLMPVGGGGSLAPAQAADLMTSIDPPVTIPMHYKNDQEKLELEPLAAFLREAGTKVEPQPRFQTSRSGLPAELTVVVLEPRG